MHWTTAVSEENTTQCTANTHSVAEVTSSPPAWLLLTLRPAWQVGIRAQSSAGPPSCQRLSPGRGSSCNEAVRGVFVQIGRTRGGEGAREPRSSWQNKSSWTDRSCWEGFFSLCLSWGATITEQCCSCMSVSSLSLSLSFSITYFLFSIIFPSVQRGQFYKSDCFTELLASQVCWTVKGTVHIQSLSDGEVKCCSPQNISGAFTAKQSCSIRLNNWSRWRLVLNLQQGDSTHVSRWPTIPY